MNVYIINTKTLDWPIYEGDYRVANSNVSFPNEFEPLPPFAWVQETTQPLYDWITQGIKEVTPTFFDGIWHQSWEVYELSNEQILKNQNISRQLNKTQASELLSATDWVELGDVSNQAINPHLLNKPEFTNYRAALRQIAVNPPVIVDTWPSKPSEVWSN